VQAHALVLRSAAMLSNVMCVPRARIEFLKKLIFAKALRPPGSLSPTTINNLITQVLQEQQFTPRLGKSSGLGFHHQICVMGLPIV
jgi:hypothetical protein